MTRAEESASKAYGGVPQLRRAFINGYEQAEKFFISKLKEYMAKGEKCMDDVLDDVVYLDKDITYSFWDGFHNCATNLLRELESETK